ncbi:MAG TPA: DNA polymerase, partial [Candidatus Saccharimonadales bacterium]
PESFEAKYKIRVDQFLDYKALVGDSSDNIPGVQGVGPVAAQKLLHDYETLDGVYENLWQLKDSMRHKLETSRDSAYMSKQIAEIWLDAPLDLDLSAMDVNDLDTAKLKTLLTQLEFRSLLRGLPDWMQSDQAVSLGEGQVADVLPDTAVGADSLLPSGPLTVWRDGDDWYLSSNAGAAAKLDVQQAMKHLAGRQLVAHRAKDVLKELLRAGATDIPSVSHDTEQAAFLLNPLQKSRALSDLMGIEETDPLVAIAAVRALSVEQAAALDKLPKLAHVAREFDFALMPVLARMEVRGIRIDQTFLQAMNDDLTRDIEATKKAMFELVGYEFNIGSPAQLGDVLFGKLQLSTLGVKKGKTGWSTGQKELDKLRGSHPIIELIEKYRELTKLQSTYVDALPKLADGHSRLHTDFRQDVAATGRLSSSDPNLQNIPVRTELGRKIRQAFVPEPGNVFVSADYSQFELRLAAVLAGDQPMIDDFNSDIDIHAKTASDVYHVPLDTVTKAQRRDAKVINFGVLYGMGPHALAQNTGMSFAEAKAFIDEYFRLRAPIRKYIDATIDHAKREGFVETYFGRRRPTPDVQSTNFMVRQSGERAAANMPIQGTEADLMKLAMLKVDQRLGDLGEQLLQIHDSILVECPADKADEVGELLKETMENIYPELGIKLKVDVSTGKNWGET